MMGWAPDALWSCTLSQFIAAMDGWIEFHVASPDDGVEPPSEEELADLIARYG